MFSNEEYLAQLLTEAGIVSADDVAQARHELSGRQTLIERLLAGGTLTQDAVADVLASNSGIPHVNLDSVSFAPGITEAVPEDIARRYHVVPIEDDGYALTLAVADPLNFEALDSLPNVLGRELTLVCATHKSIQTMLKQFYGVEDSGAGTPSDHGIVSETDDQGGDDAPIIKLVFNMLAEAFRVRASDIHIEPLETSVRIRYRMDGKLVEVANHPKKLLPAIIARLKVMSSTVSGSNVAKSRRG